jgi:hypothetical protein
VDLGPCCHGLGSLEVLSCLLAFRTRTVVSSKLPSALVGCGSSHVSRCAARLAIGSVGHNCLVTGHNHGFGATAAGVNEV